MQLAVRYAEHPNDMKGYETREMRNHFLFDQVFIEDEKRGWAVHRERSAGLIFTHERRMEVYFYFDLKPNGVVFHIHGQPDETRHIAITNEQAVISPSWSIHTRVGTSAYTFIGGMAGENQTSMIWIRLLPQPLDNSRSTLFNGAVQGYLDPCTDLCLCLYQGSCYPYNIR